MHPKEGNKEIFFLPDGEEKNFKVHQCVILAVLTTKMWRRAKEPKRKRAGSLPLYLKKHMFLIGIF